MGIVVCIVLFLGVIMFLPLPWRVRAPANKLVRYIHAVTPPLLLVLGSWNCLWYGLRHLGSFWGITALISGVAMVLAGLVLNTQNNTLMHGFKYKTYRILRVIRIPVFAVLLGSFLLYFVTLVRLNLGYEIIF